MNLVSKICIPAIAAAALVASAAQAASGYTINQFHLYTGPGHSFARLDPVPENARVHIFGCLPNFAWCDVAWGSARGWIDGHGLESYDRGRRVIVANAGPYLNLPVITYSAMYESPRARNLDDDDIIWDRD